MAEPEKPVAEDKKSDRAQILWGPLDWRGEAWRNVGGAVLALVSLYVFITDTEAHGFNFRDFAIMIAGLVIAGRMTGLLVVIAAAYPLGCAVFISMIIFPLFIIWSSIVLLLSSFLLIFGSMTTPVNYLFVTAPTAPAWGSCGGGASPLGWAFNGIQQRGLGPFPDLAPSLPGVQANPGQQLTPPIPWHPSVCAPIAWERFGLAIAYVVILVVLYRIFGS